MYSMPGNQDERADALFRVYREACPAPEPSPSFMPELWRRIEARQAYSFSFRRMANAFVTAALAFSLALGIYMAIPQSNSSYYAQSYIEALAAANTVETPEIVEPVRLEIATDSAR